MEIWEPELFENPTTLSPDCSEDHVKSPQVSPAAADRDNDGPSAGSAPPLQQHDPESLFDSPPLGANTECGECEDAMCSEGH
eukprot:1917869-Rhodomonas_salina.1